MNDERKTPRWLFDKVNEQFHFTIDLAAMAENRLCQMFYTKHSNALMQDWSNHTAWCNPPYSRGQLKQWVTKAIESPLATVLMLIPGDCSTQASQMALGHSNGVLFINRRLAFDDEPQGAKFANWLVLFGGDSRDRHKLSQLDLGVVL